MEHGTPKPASSCLGRDSAINLPLKSLQRYAGQDQLPATERVSCGTKANSGCPILKELLVVCKLGGEHGFLRNLSGWSEWCYQANVDSDLVMCEEASTQEQWWLSLKSLPQNYTAQFLSVCLCCPQATLHLLESRLSVYEQLSLCEGP